MTGATSSFARLLRDHRRAAGLTQEELAERAQLSVRAVSDLERGLKTVPRRETVELLARALGLPVEVLEQAVPRRRGPKDEPAVVRLPISPTPLIGRERDVMELTALLRRPEVRLVTVVGTAGIGKTRLALAVAEQLAAEFEGVVFLPLASARDPTLTLPQLAQALGVRPGGGPVPQRIVEFLGDRRLLLLLDNFEQLLDAAPDLAQLLTRCAGVTLLVTSRAALHLQSEHRYELAPLAFPRRGSQPSLGDLAGFPAVTLFAERAQAVNPRFQLSEQNLAAVVGICQQLEGLPLAIELASARANVLPPESMLERLGSRLQFLTHGARDLPERHQTMRDAIAWSYDLLSPEERHLFGRLSIFSGGFALDAAEAVADPVRSTDVLATLTSLIDKNLVLALGIRGDAPRYLMLETIREFGGERLVVSGEQAAVARRHAEHFVRFAERAYTEQVGNKQATSFRQVERELDNLRAAARWILAAGDDELAARLGLSLWRFWDRGQIDEGRHWLDAFLALPGLASPTLQRCHLLFAAGRLAYRQADYAPATEYLESCLTVAEAVHDEDFIGTARTHLGHLAYARGDLDRAERHYAAALSARQRMGDDARSLAIVLIGLGRVERARGRYLEAAVLFERSLVHLRAAHDVLQIGVALCELGSVALLRGDDAEAERLFRESLGESRSIGDDSGIARAMIGLALSAIRLGRLGEARGLLLESLSVGRRAGGRQHIAQSLEGFAALQAAEARPGQAWRLAAATEAYREQVAVPRDCVERVLVERFLEPAAARLTPRQRAELWRAGRQLSLEQALPLIAGSAPADPDPPASDANADDPGADGSGFKIWAESPPVG